MVEDIVLKTEHHEIDSEIREKKGELEYNLNLLISEYVVKKKELKDFEKDIFFPKLYLADYKKIGDNIKKHTEKYDKFNKKIISLKSKKQTGDISKEEKNKLTQQINQLEKKLYNTEDLNEKKDLLLNIQELSYLFELLYENLVTKKGFIGKKREEVLDQKKLIPETKEFIKLMRKKNMYLFYHIKVLDKIENFGWLESIKNEMVIGELDTDKKPFTDMIEYFNNTRTELINKFISIKKRLGLI